MKTTPIQLGTYLKSIKRNISISDLAAICEHWCHFRAKNWNFSWYYAIASILRLANLTVTLVGA